ncbi:MAG: hypothetical protein AB7G07_13245, partial [Bauldia sp.]
GTETGIGMTGDAVATFDLTQHAHVFKLGVGVMFSARSRRSRRGRARRGARSTSRPERLEAKPVAAPIAWHPHNSRRATVRAQLRSRPPQLLHLRHHGGLGGGARGGGYGTRAFALGELGAGEVLTAVIGSRGSRGNAALGSTGA